MADSHHCGDARPVRIDEVQADFGAALFFGDEVDEIRQEQTEWLHHFRNSMRLDFLRLFRSSDFRVGLEFWCALVPLD